METNDNEKLFEWQGEQPIRESGLNATYLSASTRDWQITSGTLKLMSGEILKIFKWTARNISKKPGEDRWVIARVNTTGSSAGKVREHGGSQFAHDDIVDLHIRLFMAERLCTFHRNGNGVLPQNDTGSQPVNQTIRVDISEIQALKGQPREEFDNGVIMAESLYQEGQLQDIIVTPLVGVPGKKWELVDGERRLRAATLSGIKQVDVKVRHFKDRADQYWSSFVANLQRADHTPLEKSNAVAKAFAIGKTLQEICRATGWREHQVRLAFQLQKLAPSLRLLLRRDIPKKQQMRVGAARVLSKIPNQSVQEKIWAEAMKQSTVGLVQLKVNELAAPHLAHLHRSRKLQPSDKAKRIARIIKTAETDMTFLDALTAEEARVFLGKDPSVASSTVLSLNNILASLERFKRQLFRVSHEKPSIPETA